MNLIGRFFRVGSSGSHGSLYCLSLCLYLDCLKKSTEKARVKWQAFSFKIARIHSLLEMRVQTKF